MYDENIDVFPFLSTGNIIYYDDERGVNENYTQGVAEIGVTITTRQVDDVFEICFFPPPKPWSYTFYS